MIVSNNTDQKVEDDDDKTSIISLSLSEEDPSEDVVGPELKQNEMQAPAAILLDS